MTARAPDQAFDRETVVNDLGLAVGKIGRALVALSIDRPSNAFGELSDALALQRAVMDEIVEECRRCGFDVGKPKKRNPHADAEIARLTAELAAANQALGVMHNQRDRAQKELRDMVRKSAK